MSPSTPTTDLNKTNWIVEVTEDVEHMRSNFDDERHWKKHSIYRVPDCVAKLNREAYWPEAVSFGPYHHGEDHLLPMENHKHRALLHFLRRSGKPVERFLKSLSDVAQELQDSYHLLDPWWKEGDGEGAGPFLKLMITDGCFMLEILRTKIRLRGEYASNDPIFGNLGGLYIRPYIMRDMLMLENQLPMLVLDRLVAVESDGMQDHEFVNRLILEFFFSPCTPNEKMGKCLHVLDVYRKRLLLPGNPDEVGPEDGERTIQSATELEEAGIRLEKSRTDSFKDISFAGGVLRLPPIMVNDTTESKFLNLMTFERFHDGAGNEVTAYMYFMDDIIDTERDVTLLNARGIIQNDFGSDKAVAELFNSLNKDMALDENNSLEALRNKVSKYCKKPWNKWRANLIKTYFRSPWSILSLLCAIFLFTLTIIQTIYTVSPAG
ncbi:UPF0481 protein At3g47200 [Eucalyptus grandis]|uniref:Uncharacterized protein n=2 Tax=Eucalyptus grandis TaxID=71139 RepID=A0ACC3J015_EUCGR|nr:UPF0481 protein At3g47200 [Eucalyptus grandis]KAK3407570.1 hypothetical protein EUGRSUZ_K03612 [Eucalyptus grandis]